MKILFLNHNIKGEGTYFRAFNFARKLARRGHEMTLITLSPRRFFTPVSYMEDGVKIIESPKFLDLDGGGWAPLDIIYRIFHTLRNRYDIIHGFDHKPNVYFPMLAGRRAFGQTVLFSDWADWWTKGGISEGKRIKPEVLIETGLEESIRLRSDAVTVISMALKERAISVGVPVKKVIHIPSGCDTEMIKPATGKKSSTIKSKYGLPANKKILEFIGFGQTDLGVMIDAFGELMKQRSDAVFVIIGPLDKKLKKKVSYFGFPSALYMPGKVPYSSVAEYAAVADIFLLPLENNGMNRARWPNKTGDYLAAGRPMVVNPVGDIAPLLKKYKFGLTASFDPRDIAARISELLDNARLMKACGERARKFAVNNLNWDVLTDKLEKAYIKIAAEKKAYK